MFKATGINGDNIDEMSERIEDMIGNNDVNADPSEFLRSLASGEFGNSFEEDDDGYEFDEDSTPINVADADESKSGDEEEERKQGFLGGMFGRRPGSMAGKDDEKRGENGKKLKNRSRLKYLNEFGTNLTQRAQEGKIDRIIKREIPEAPHEVFLVLDATTGQNAITQAKVFTETTKVTGVVLTKLDGTAKGGVVVAIREELGLPVKWIGVGEGIMDFRPFEPEKFVDALFATEETDAE
jgi:hypothetical protein